MFDTHISIRKNYLHDNYVTIDLRQISLTCAMRLLAYRHTKSLQLVYFIDCIKGFQLSWLSCTQKWLQLVLIKCVTIVTPIWSWMSLKSYQYLRFCKVPYFESLYSTTFNFLYFSYISYKLYRLYSNCFVRCIGPLFSIFCDHGEIWLHTDD